MKLVGKTALVTGSSRGIGTAIALELARQGADLSINYRSNADAAEAVAERVRQTGRRCIPLQADVTDSEQVDSLVQKTEEELGSVDILVNNVGDFYFKPLTDMEPGEWRYVLESNLSSVFYLSRAVIPKMRQRKQGRIVNIGLSPNYMVRGAPNVAAYSIAKTGVVIHTRSLAVEEAPHGINVNCVSPGLIDNGHLPEDQKQWMEERVPAGRLGTAQEIADAVFFLCSDRATYVSGANLTVCGAWDWQDRPTDHDQLVTDLFLEDDS